MACQNPTWAGGIASQRPYRTVEAIWSLPCVNTEASGTFFSAWVGLGGVTSTATLVQAGIDNNINEQGQVLYKAWTEAYTPASTTTAFHDNQVNLVFAQGLHCGDLLYVQVNSDVEGKVDRDYPDTYFVGNLTTGEYQYYNPAAWRASDGSSAEWIVERPTFMGCVARMMKKPKWLGDPRGFTLGDDSKQCGDQRDLPFHVSFFHPLHLPFPQHVHHLESL